MDAPSLTGGCQCGAVRYRINAAQVVCYACHCRDCQKMSGSAFGISVPIRRTDLEVAGPLRSWQRRSPSGAMSDCFFCGTCGSRILHASTRDPAVVTLRGGTLDDTSGLQPAAHIWVGSKQPWLALPEDAATFDTQPTDLGGWRASLMAG